jgi:hypothetical protein
MARKAAAVSGYERTEQDGSTVEMWADEKGARVRVGGRLGAELKRLAKAAGVSAGVLVRGAIAQELRAANLL